MDEKAKHLAEQSQAVHALALSTHVRSPYEYEKAADQLKIIKGKYKEVEDWRVHLKEPVLEQGRRIDDFFRAPLKFLSEAETILKRALLGYEQEQKRLAAEKQRQAEETARRERETLEAQARAERERGDREAAELKQQASRLNEAGQTSESMALIVEASALVLDSEERAQIILETAKKIIAPLIPEEITLVVGQHTKTIWRARIVNAKLVPEAYKVVDDKLIQGFAKSTKGKIPVPGLEFYSEEIKFSRSA